jgi:hypothetical protein
VSAQNGLNLRERRWLALALAAGLGAWAPESQSGASAAAEPPTSAADDAEVARFLQGHWARPLAPQGPPPASAAAQGITLAAGSCATCHAAQFEDWRQSLHSRAMGPGVLGQLLSMPAHARDDHQDCLRCHAPLAEQADSLIAARNEETGNKPGGVRAVGALHEQGLVCAACHVRKFEWYGPPRRDGSQPPVDASTHPHGGWKASSAFSSSQFCAACHQFDDDGYALNGKLLENTVREWQDSRYAREGVSCQSCHMPDRRHQWRGIHDPDMVRKGIEIRTAEPVIASGQVAARLSVTNTGVGHYFPTYVTPRIVIRAIQLDTRGNGLKATAREFVIGRQVLPDLSREIADTRIAPDARAIFDYRGPRHAGASALAWQVEVQPDAFYLAFYDALLGGATAGRNRQLLVRARDAALASPYIVFSQRLPLH